MTQNTLLRRIITSSFSSALTSRTTLEKYTLPQREKRIDKRCRPRLGPSLTQVSCQILFKERKTVCISNGLLLCGTMTVIGALIARAKADLSRSPPYCCFLLGPVVLLPLSLTISGVAAELHPSSEFWTTGAVPCMMRSEYLWGVT